ncbi:stress enhanced protein 2, chloroplastic-like [Rutidosis leptorrhynchoides]|uniref:stress enhanced protein 2, chloroplastic-like n=1 Tax=Rutidosis leptorrhynchoides TaxID=125765 RepID=UPI003A992D9F
MATVARAIHCNLETPKPTGMMKVGPMVQRGYKLQEVESKGKIVLQPRLCTLRSYGGGVMKRKDGGDEHVSSSSASQFFETLSEYIESTRKSRDFEIISGRFAMIVFAATVSREVVTGNSVFSKMDTQGIIEAAGLCLGAVTFAAIFAWLSSNRNRVGSMFSISCNTFIDTPY